MKKWVALLLGLLLLSGCKGGEEEPYYGTLDSKENLSAVLSLSGNQLLYRTTTDEAGIAVMDVRNGKSAQICVLPDYLASPENIVCESGIFYLNYLTKEMGRKMLAIDTVHRTAETVREWGSHAFLNETYSAAGEDAVYSLSQDCSGCYRVERYEPEEDGAVNGWPLQSVKPIRAISVFADQLHAIISEREKDVIVQYDENGNPVKEWDIRNFAGSYIREGQIEHFQFMGECFFIKNRSGSSYGFWLDGTPIEALTGCSIASNDPSDRELHIFYRKGSAEPLLIFSTESQTLSAFQPEIPEGFLIQAAAADFEDSARLLLLLENEKTGKEQMSILSVTPQSSPG